MTVTLMLCACGTSKKVSPGARAATSMVAGQLLPGIPVWRVGDETRFPGLTYVVFPGNVGGPEALKEAVNKFARRS